MPDPKQLEPRKPCWIEKYFPPVAGAQEFQEQARSAIKKVGLKDHCAMTLTSNAEAYAGFWIVVGAVAGTLATVVACKVAQGGNQPQKETR